MSGIKTIKSILYLNIYHESNGPSPILPALQCPFFLSDTWIYIPGLFARNGAGVRKSVIKKAPRSPKGMQGLRLSSAYSLIVISLSETNIVTINKNTKL